MSIVVVAYNEADRICRADRKPAGARLSARAARDRGCLGRIDRRHGRARAVLQGAWRDESGHLRHAAAKPAVLNAVVPTLRSDIVVFADARQRFDRHTLRALVDNFCGPDGWRRGWRAGAHHGKPPGRRRARRGVLLAL